MKRISLIVKVTNGCNLRCKYCYNGGAGFSNEVLKIEHFKKMLSLLGDEYDEATLIWHGGEPLTAGKEYYKKAMEIEEEISLLKDIKFDNRVQTNGTLIDKDWIKFFKKHGFKLGLSYDGVDNDAYRQQGEKVLKNMDLLKKNGIRFGVIAVVVNDEYDLKKNYEFFKNRNTWFEFSHMIPEGSGKDLAQVGAEEYAKKMINFFDEWIYDRDGVGVRTFQSYMIMALGGKARVCDNSSCHGRYLCIAPDGSIFNCSRGSAHEYSFGHIDEIESVKEAFNSDGFKKLLIGSITRRNKCKSECEYFDLCKGGCADAAICAGNINEPSPYACTLFKKLYKHIKAKMDEIVEKNIPLDNFNPAVREAFASKLSATEKCIHNEEV